MRRAPSKSAPSKIALQGDGDQMALDGVLDIHTLEQARSALGKWIKQRKSRSLD